MFQQEYVTVKWAVMLIQMLMECWVVMWALSLLDVAASTGVNPERDRQISLMVTYIFLNKKNLIIWFAYFIMYLKKKNILSFNPHMLLRSGLFFSPVGLINHLMGCFCLCFQVDQALWSSAQTATTTPTSTRVRVSTVRTPTWQRTTHLCLRSLGMDARAAIKSGISTPSTQTQHWRVL